MPDTAILKVAIVEDQPRIRESLQVLIGCTGGFRCTGAFDSMEAALASIGCHLPDVALVDIGLPGMSGIEGIRELKKRYPDLTLIMMTVYDDDKRIFDALCAGACGYLLKKTPPARLLESLREAAGGGSPMSPEVARRVVSLFREIRPREDAACQLTPHEIRLLKLLVEGHNYKTSAAELNLSVNTIRFHIKSIYGKLQVHSKSEAVAKGLRQRIVR
ncbi:MAG: response regulator transcription factor [Bryobacteraceae bacterium]|jgi:DNA-binding NarL/FixJ family response regulator